MLSTMAGILVVLWFLGLITSYTMGGFIHILFVIAIIMMLINFLRDRRFCRGNDTLLSGRALAESEWNISGISLYQLTRRKECAHE